MSWKHFSVWTVLITFLALALGGCSKSGERAVDATAEAPEIGRVESGLLPAARVVGELGRSLADRMAYYKVPAISIAVIYDFELVWAKAYGLADQATGQPATTETLFQAASISKPVTATAALRRVEAGSLEKQAKNYDAVIVLGCDSATETVRDVVPADVKVIEGMKTAGIMNGRMSLRLPGDLFFEGCKVVPISQQKAA